MHRSCRRTHRLRPGRPRHWRKGSLRRPWDPSRIFSLIAPTTLSTRLLKCRTFSMPWRAAVMSARVSPLAPRRITPTLTRRSEAGRKLSTWSVKLSMFTWTTSRLRSAPGFGGPHSSGGLSPLWPIWRSIVQRTRRRLCTSGACGASSRGCWPGSGSGSSARGPCLTFVSVLHNLGGHNESSFNDFAACTFGVIFVCLVVHRAARCAHIVVGSGSAASPSRGTWIACASSAITSARADTRSAAPLAPPPRPLLSCWFLLFVVVVVVVALLLLLLLLLLFLLVVVVRRCRCPVAVSAAAVVAVACLLAC